MDQSKTLAAQLDTMTVDTIAHRARAERYFAAEQAAKAQLAAAEHQLQHATQIEGGRGALSKLGQTWIRSPTSSTPVMRSSRCRRKHAQCATCRCSRMEKSSSPPIFRPRACLVRISKSCGLLARWCDVGIAGLCLGKSVRTRKLTRITHELRLRRNGQLVVMDTETHRTLWGSTRMSCR